MRSGYFTLAIFGNGQSRMKVVGAKFVMSKTLFPTSSRCGAAPASYR